MLVFLGNNAGKDWSNQPVLDADGRPQLGDDGQVLTEKRSHRLDGSQVTTVHVPDADADGLGGATRTEILNSIVGPNGLWAQHSHEPPVFVYVPDSKPLQDFLAEDLGCASGVPDDWDGPAMTDAAAAALPVPGDPPVGELLPTDTPTDAATDAGFVPQGGDDALADAQQHAGDAS